MASSPLPAATVTQMEARVLIEIEGGICGKAAHDLLPTAWGHLGKSPENHLDHSFFASSLMTSSPTPRLRI
jgi:hypothetical protein